MKTKKTEGTEFDIHVWIKPNGTATLSLGNRLIAYEMISSDAGKALAELIEEYEDNACP